MCRCSRKHRRKRHREPTRTRGGSGDVELDIDEDDGSVSIETDEGSIQIGGDQILDDFPLPLPDYEEVAGVITQTDGGTTYTQVILGFDPDAIDEVADLYEDFFNDQGWDVSRTDSSSDGTTLVIINGTADEVDATALIGFGEDNDAASLTLSYGTG